MEDRANVLEIVSERLSKHVLANYDTFVRGINEAASVEADLQATYSPSLLDLPHGQLLLCICLQLNTGSFVHMDGECHVSDGQSRCCLDAGKHVFLMRFRGTPQSRKL